MINKSPCTCCGQERDYPTEPGKWQYKYHYSEDWTDVDIVASDEGLMVIVGGEAIWWPNNVMWRQSVVSPGCACSHFETCDACFGGR